MIGSATLKAAYKCPIISIVLFLDDNSMDLHYVNLLKNPERYTGYKGNSAQKIWQAIYQENCFKPDSRFDKDFLLNPEGNNGMCLEKRVFYRLISGLHSAITVSIAAYNYKPGKYLICFKQHQNASISIF